MIYGLLNQGSGAGNQLHRYIATRIKALELNTDWRLIWNPDNSGKPEGFKCKDFMQFDESKVIPYWDWGSSNAKEFIEKKVVENGMDIRSYDPEWNFIEDNTVIEGEFQDERYWEKYAKEVNEWLKVETLGEQKGWICNGDKSTVWREKPDGMKCEPYLEMPDDLCVIGFRGGEFAVFPDLFLTYDYWREAIEKMLKVNPEMKFEVHTDDTETASRCLNEVFKDIEFKKEVKYIHDIGINWRSMRYAEYAIIANSSFYILPRWLKQWEDSKAITIAPRYWARRNTKVWALPQNYYKGFQYI